MKADDAVFLRAAETIAQYLSETAHEWQERCTWLSTTQASDEWSTVALTYETVGPDLYAGSCGIALFLAEMFRNVRLPRYRAVALDAMRQALHQSSEDGAENSGFYSGAVGVAYAGVRVGDLCGDEDVFRQAASIVDAIDDDSVEMSRFDVIDGIAGIAPALAALSVSLNRPELAERAIRLGHRLLAAATKHSGGWSWGEGAPDDAPHLTGFAHGAAGVSWCLAELYRISRDQRLLDGARQAVQYEDGWFAHEEGNWRDLRDCSVEDLPQYGMGWCAGAPGIGLSRLRLMQVCNQAAPRRDAEAAVRTCKEALTTLEDVYGFDYSLCHGRGGMSELLLFASRYMGDAEAELVARRTARKGVELFADRPAEWPCGVIRGPNPSLMLGTAGIGYSLLRLIDPSTPSILMIDVH